MKILLGSTGFLGQILSSQISFDICAHRPNSHQVREQEADLFVCCAAPAEKWRANADPVGDLENLERLWADMSTIRAKRAILFSTIDVYDPAINVDEDSQPSLKAPQAYGRHRAELERRFSESFANFQIVRLPGLFAPTLKKNLIYDLLHERHDQLRQISPDATFQFFDARRSMEIADLAWAESISVLNVSSEPVSAQDVADLFGFQLTGSNQATYDVRSKWSRLLTGREDGYLESRASVLNQILRLKDSVQI